MADSGLQVLLHAGEVHQMVTTIQQNRHKCVGGCLFGLWRNSLKQPVIQFVTSAAGGFGSVDEIIGNQRDSKCEEIMKKKHAVLKLGHWFWGSSEEKDRALSRFHGSDDNLLLLITFDGAEFAGVYHLKQDREEARVELCKEDVLSGNSSFRIYEPLTKEIRSAGAYHVEPAKEERLQHIYSYTEKLPSRATIRDPETKKEQWYSSEEGVQKLQKLVQYMNEASIQVDMTRDAASHNIQFNMTGGYCLDFPVDFPTRMPAFFDRRGELVRLNIDFQRGGDICLALVKAVHAYFQSRARR